MSSQLPQALAPDVLLAASGSREAFARLVDRTSSMVCSITVAIVRNVEDSEDLAQEIYLAAWHTLPKLRNPESFLPWLRQTARNKARHAARTHVRAARHRIGGEESINFAFAALPDPNPTADEALLLEEEHGALEEALSLLPDDTREVIALHYRENQSVRAVAELLELSESAVKKRLQRGREALRKDLLERAGDALRRTTPGSTLTVAVIAGLTLGAPASAAAATVGLGGTAAGGGFLAKMAAMLGGAAAGAFGGCMGFITAMHFTNRRIRSEEDRRRMRRLTIVGCIYVSIMSIAFPIGYTASHTSGFLIAWFLILVIGVLLISFGWGSKILRASLQAELEEDPVGAAARHRRERYKAVFGVLCGILLGGIPIVWAIMRR